MTASDYRLVPDVPAVDDFVRLRRDAGLTPMPRDRAEAGLPAPGPDRFGYTAFVYTGDTDEEGMRVGSKLLWFLNTGLKAAPQYSKFLPGQTPPEQAPALYRTRPAAAAGPARVAPASRNAAALIGIDAEQAIARGLMFAGNPDTVYRQIMEFQDKVGRFEHLILASRSASMLAKRFSPAHWSRSGVGRKARVRKRNVRKRVIGAFARGDRDEAHRGRRTGKGNSKCRVRVLTAKRV